MAWPPMQYTQRVPTTMPLAGAVEVYFHLAGYAPEHRYERLITTVEAR